MSMKQKGKIKWFNAKKGFGFIVGEFDSKDYFLHSSCVPEGVQVNPDDEVLFDVKESQRGLQAINVELIE